MDRLRLDDSKFNSLLENFEVAITADPEAALQLAKQALDLAEKYRGVEAWRRSWRGLALAAQAYRRLSRFNESYACVESAAKLIYQGRPDSVGKREKQLAWGLVALRHAFWARDTGNSDLSERCLLEQREIYQLSAQEYLGRNLIDQAIVLQTSRPDWFEIASVAENGLSLMQMSQDPNTAYRNAGLVLRLYAECERPAPKRTNILDRLRELELLQEDPSPLAKTSFDWIAGRALLAAGRSSEGEERLESVIDRFVQLDQPIRAARAALDLALGLMTTGAQPKAGEIVGRLFPILGRLRHHKEAAAALMMYCSAAAKGTLTVSLVQNLRRWLERRP